MVPIHRVTGSEIGRIRTREDTDHDPCLAKLSEKFQNQAPRDEEESKDTSEEGKVGKAIKEALKN